MSLRLMRELSSTSTKFHQNPLRNKNFVNCGTPTPHPRWEGGGEGEDTFQNFENLAANFVLEGQNTI